MTRRAIVEMLFSRGWEMVKVNAKEATFAPVNTRTPARFYRGE